MDEALSGSDLGAGDGRHEEEGEEEKTSNQDFMGVDSSRKEMAGHARASRL